MKAMLNPSWILSLCLALISSCTTLQPVRFEPEVLQREIAAGNIVKPGDKVRITTVNGERIEFKVLAVNNTDLVGQNQSIPITDILALDTLEFSAGKTGAVVGGMTLGYVILLSIALSSLVFIP